MNQNLPHPLKIPAMSDVPPSVMFPLIDSSFFKTFWKKDSLSIFITAITDHCYYCLNFYRTAYLPYKNGWVNHFLDFSHVALHLKSFMFKQAQHPKATLETLSLCHCLKSVPAGPGWGLTGPLLSSMNWLNSSLQWNTNKLKRLYISQEKKKVMVLVIRWTLKNTHDRMQSEMQIQSLSSPGV